MIGLRVNSFAFCFFWSLLVLGFSEANGQSQGFQKYSYTASDGIALNYQMLKPWKVEKGKKYPLILFLHGAGERGNDNELQMTHGSRMFTNPVNRDKYPAYVLFPQCPPGGYWSFETRPEKLDASTFNSDLPITAILNRVYELLRNVMANESVDLRRVYVIGLSMGGMATFDLVSRYPETFAAAVPVCGATNPDRLMRIRNVTFRIYHGDEDNVVNVEFSRAAYRSLKSSGAKVTYFEFPGVNHGSWTPAFNDPDLMRWLFRQKK